MDPHLYQSSYLSVRRQASYGGGRQRRLLVRLRLLMSWMPRLGWRTWSGLALWGLIFVVGLYGFEHQTIPLPPADVAAADSGGRGGATPTTPAQLTAASKATALPGGPTGQLLPPGTMAAPYTYANSYTAGQCTWYVAGRRPIPRGWGNANTWLAHARAVGWATGSTPAIAAVAWTNAGYYGHVALVEDVNAETGQVLISEMNYLGPYKLDKRWVNASAFTYIY